MPLDRPSPAIYPHNPGRSFSILRHSSHQSLDLHGPPEERTFQGGPAHKKQRCRWLEDKRLSPPVETCAQRATARQSTFGKRLDTKTLSAHTHQSKANTKGNIRFHPKQFCTLGSSPRTHPKNHPNTLNQPPSPPATPETPREPEAEASRRGQTSHPMEET